MKIKRINYFCTLVVVLISPLLNPVHSSSLWETAVGENAVETSGAFKNFDPSQQPGFKQSCYKLKNVFVNKDDLEREAAKRMSGACIMTIENAASAFKGKERSNETLEGGALADSIEQIIVKMGYETYDQIITDELFHHIFYTWDNYTQGAIYIANYISQECELFYPEMELEPRESEYSQQLYEIFSEKSDMYMNLETALQYAMEAVREFETLYNKKLMPNTISQGLYLVKVSELGRLGLAIANGVQPKAPWELARAFQTLLRKKKLTDDSEFGPKSI